jgi:hypothetical protein
LGHEVGFVEEMSLNLPQVVTKVMSWTITKIVAIVKIVIPGRMLKWNHGAALCYDHSETSMMMVDEWQYQK